MLSKSLPFSVPSLGRQISALALLLGAAGVVYVASLPRFQYFDVPAERLPFVACIYVALLALAALPWQGTATLRRLAWTPVACHLTLVIFASVSFARHGHWPFYSHPDPSGLRLPWLYLLSILAVPTAWATLAANALAIVLHALGDRPGEWRERLPALLHHAAILAFSVWLWMFEFRDRRLLEWLAD